MSSRSCLGVAVAGALFCVAWSAPIAFAQSMTLTMSSWVPPHHSVTRALVVWGQEIEKATGGRVKSSMLPKMVVAPTGTLDAVRDGLVDVSFIAHGYTPGRFVATKIAELPFLGDNVHINSVAYQRIFERHLARVNEHKGVKVLAMFTHGPGELHSTKKPITSLADLAGLKIRSGGGLIQEVAKAIGANAVMKAAPESYELLSSGVVDASFSPPEGFVSLGLQKTVKFVTHIPGGLYNTSFAVLMNEDRFNKLPKADQEAIDKLAGEHLSNLVGRMWNEGDQTGIAAMKTEGVKVITADAAMVKDIRDKTAGIEDAWVKEASAKGFDAAKALADYREEIKKLSAAPPSSK